MPAHLPLRTCRLRPSVFQLFALSGLLLLGLGLASTARAAVVQHTGTISAQTTWSVDDVHQVTGDVTVNAGVILTIEPGAVVKFNANAGLYISGALNAVGTLGEPIVFTSYRDDAYAGDTNGDGASQGYAGDWDGITFYSTTTVSQTRLERATVRYGGHSNANVYVDTAAVAIVDCELSDSSRSGIYFYNSSGSVEGSLIEDSAEQGIYVYYGAAVLNGNTIRGAQNGIYSRYSTPSIDNNTIADNSGWGIYTYDARNLPLVTGNTITGNYRSAILPATAVPNSGDGNVLLPNTLEGLWIRGNTRATDLRLEVLSDGAGHELGSYQFYDTTTFSSGVGLTVDPGVTVKFYQNARWDIYGHISAVGTSALPIGFTSALDDSLGGDLNADGSSTAPYRGYWGAISLHSSADAEPNVFEHARFRYGGNANNAQLYVTNRVVSLSQVEIAFSSTHGLRVNAGTALVEDAEVFGNQGDGLYFDYAGGGCDVTGGRVFANSGDGIEYYSSATGSVHGAEIFGNDESGLDAGSVVIDATGNWWGAADGPSGEGPGSGDGITTNVNVLDGESGLDVLVTGSAFSYLNAGPNLVEGTIAAPVVTQGTDSSEWGTGASTRILYHADNVLLDYPTLDPSARYELFVTYLNKDDASGVGGNQQSLLDGDGGILHGLYTTPTSTPNQRRVEISAASYAGGSLRLDFQRDSGYRAVVSEVWIVEKRASADVTAPTSTITSPSAGARLSTSPVLIEGHATDGAGTGVASVELGVDDGSSVSWRPVTQLRSDGTWSYRWALPADGSYTLRARARDHADYLEIPDPGAGVSVDVDRTNPEPPLTLGAWDAPGDAGGVIELSWDLSVDDGAGDDDVVGYELSRRSDALAAYDLVATEATLVAGTTSTSDSSVVDGVDYEYRLIAVDSAGNRSSAAIFSGARAIDNDSAGDLQAPEEISGFVATAGDSLANLGWTESVNSQHDLVDQLLSGSADGGVTWGANAPDFDDGLTISLGVVVDQAVVTGLTNGSAYSFRLRVLDSSGNQSAGVISSSVTPSATASTPVSGTISEDTTWAAGVYRVTAHLTIASGATLTILPGVIVKVESGRIIYVQGALDAVGSEGSPVVFTSFSDDSWGGDTNADGPSTGAPGDWARIEFQDSTNEAKTRFEHVLVRYGGSGSNGSVYTYAANLAFRDCEIELGSSHGLYAYSSVPLVERCHVHDNASYGIYVRYNSGTIRDSQIQGNQNGVYSQGAVLTIQDNEITGNTNYGVYYTGADAAPPPTGNIITGNAQALCVPFSALPEPGDGNTLAPNTSDIVRLRGNTLTRAVSPASDGVYYLIDGTATIAAGAHLSLAEGAIWKFASNARMTVYGALTTVGSVGAPVVFTSYRDDSVGGDTNGDGASAGLANDWYDLRFYDSVVDHLTTLYYTEVRYAGRGGAGNVYVENASILLDHCLVRDGSSFGVYAYNNATRIQDCEIRDHGDHGIYLYYGSPEVRATRVSDSSNGIYARYATPAIHDNEIVDNRGWGIYYYDARDAEVITGNTISGNFRSAILPASSLPNVGDGNTLLPNSIDGIWVRGNTRNNDLQLSVITDAGSGTEISTYQIYGTLTMGSATTLTVDPGVTVKFVTSARLDVNGGFVAEGTEALPIAFTSYRDDAFGGDLNIDGAGSRPVPGDWGSVYLTSNVAAPSRIYHSVFRYGGSANSANLYTYQRTLDVQNCRFNGSSNHGLRIAYSPGSLVGVEAFANASDGVNIAYTGAVVVSEGRFYANQGDGVEFYSSASGSVSASELFGNVGYGLRAGANLIEATGNWWGAPDGPSVEGPGAGDGITTNVDLGDPVDVLTSGSAWLYFNAGPNSSEGSLAAPTVLRGTDTTDFGTSADRRALYDLESVRLGLSGLQATARYDLITTTFNTDNTASIGGNYQRLADEDGVEIRPAYEVPGNAPRMQDVLLPLASYGDGAVELEFIRTKGFRAVLSQLWLVSRPASADGDGPVSTITAPGDGAVLSGSLYEVRGLTLDDSQVTSVELGIDSGGGAVWRPVTQRYADGSWMYRWTLPADGAYRIYARAVDAAGNPETISAWVDVIVHNTPPLPATDLAAWDTANDAGGSVSLSWTLSADDGAGADDVASYRVERAADGVGVYGVLGSVAAGVATYTDATTTDGLAYTYRVACVDDAANETTSDSAGPISSIDNLAAGDTTPPEDVTDLIGSPGDGFVRLTWTPSADSAGDLVEQRLDISIDGGSTWGANAPNYDDGAVVSISKALEAWLVTGLTNGVAHRFRLRVIDSSSNLSAGAATGDLTPSNTAYTTVSGTISEDTTWSTGVYVVTANLTIAASATLTIMPGVIVKVSAGRVIYVQGGLTAVGTALAPVVFTSFADDSWGGDNDNNGPTTGTPGDWARIEFQDATNEAETLLEHVLVRFAGSGGSGALYLYSANFSVLDCEIEQSSSHGIYTYYATPLIERCHIHDNANQGVHVRYNSAEIRDCTVAGNAHGLYSQGAVLTIEDNLITDNSGYGIYYTGAQDAPPLLGNTVTGNAQALCVPFSSVPDPAEGNTLSPNTNDILRIRGNAITRNLQLPADLVYYLIDGTANVPSGVVLKLDAGVIWKSVSNGRLQIAGALASTGTELSPVVLTSYRDDTVGGDTNGDGVSTGAADDWRDVYVTSTAIDFLTRLDYTEIRYGGNGDVGNVYVESVDITLDHCLIRDGSSYGIYLYNNATSVLNSEIRDHANHGFYSYYGAPELRGTTITGTTNGVYTRYSTPSIHDNEIVDNSGWGIYYYDARDAGVITGNTITGNARSAIIPATSIPAPADGNVLLPNAIDGLWIRGNTRATDLRLPYLDDGVNQLATYQIYGTLTMSAGTILTVDPGVIVKFSQNARLTAVGGVEALGTEALPIAFTADTDDRRGGDFNNDGASTTPRDGRWYNLRLESNAAAPMSHFSYVTFAYGGGADSGMVYAYHNRTASFENCSFHNSSTNGLRVYRGAVSVTDSEAWGNRGDGLRFEYDGTHDVTGGRFFGNNGDGIEYTQNATGTISGAELFANNGYGLRANAAVSAPGNWWGAVDGPSGSGPGAGDEISAAVAMGPGGDDFLLDGSEFSYIDAGGANQQAYGLSSPILTGTPSTEWGTTPGESVVFDMDNQLITAEIAGLTPTGSYGLHVTYLNRDVDGSVQEIQDFDGNVVHSALSLPTSTPMQFGTVIPRDVFASSALNLELRGLSGSRTVVSELLVVERPTTDETAPSVSITEPADGLAILGSSLHVRGVSSDPEGLVASVEIGVTPAGGATTWYTADSLVPTGDWELLISLATGSYELVARALDPSGNLGVSDVVTLSLDSSAPAAPTELGVFGVSGALRVLWVLSADDGAGWDDVASYSVLRDPDPLGAFPEVGQAAAGVGHYDDTDVIIGNFYYYRVVAVDAVGNETASATYGPVEATAAIDTTPPEDVTDLTAEPNHVDGQYPSLRVTWTPSANSAGDLVDHRLYMSVDGGTTWGSNAPDFDNGVGTRVARSWTETFVTGLSTGQAYSVRMTAVDAVPNESAGTTVAVTVTGAASEVVTIGGDLHEDRSLPAGVYRVTTNLRVMSDATLTFAPGSVIKFNSGRYLQVSDGALYAVGTLSDPIVFTALTDDDYGGDTNGDGPSSGTRGYWNYLLFEDATHDATTRLEHAAVRFANNNVYSNYTSIALNSVEISESGENGMYVYGGAPSVVDCDIHDNDESGIYARYATVEVRGNALHDNKHGLYLRNSTAQIHDNAVTDNTSYGIYFYDAANNAPITGNVVTGNDIGICVPISAMPDASNQITPNIKPLIRLRGNTLTQDTQLGRWAAGTADEVRDYQLFNGEITVPAGMSLGIDEGVTVKFALDSGITVNGVLVAEGSYDEPITFTAHEDDSVGLSYSGNPGTVPGNGSWRGLSFVSAQFPELSILRHARVRYAGRNGNGGVYLYDSPIAIEDSIISNSSTQGIYINACSPTIAGVNLWGNSENGVYITNGVSNPSLTFSTFATNGSDGVEIYSAAGVTLSNNRFLMNRAMGVYNRTSVDVDASQSWWGDVDGSGPYQATTNALGTGDAVSDHVIYAPFEGSVLLPYAYENFSVAAPASVDYLSETTLVQGELSDEWDAGSLRADRTMAWHGEAVIASWTGLDPALAYALRVSYFNGDPAASYQSIEDGAGNPVHVSMLMPTSGPQQFEFDIPAAYYAAGDLELRFLNDNQATSFRGALPELWLMERQAEISPPRFESVAYNDLDGSGTLSVGDEYTFGFSEALDTSALSSGGSDADSHLTVAGGLSYGAVNELRWSADEASVIVSLTAGFTIAGGELVTPVDIDDPHGNAAVGVQTLPVIDTVAPRFIGLDWNDLDLDGQNSLGDEHVFSFSEAMEVSVIQDGTTGANAHLRPQGGTRYGTVNSLEWSPDGSQVTVTVTEGFTIDGDETVVPSGFVTDVAGNVVTGTQLLKGKDSTAPSLTGVAFDDRDGSGSVSLGDRYRFFFDEAIGVSVLSDYSTEANLNLSPDGKSYGSVNRIYWNDAHTEVDVAITAGFTVVGGERVEPAALVRDEAGNPATGFVLLPLIDEVLPQVVTAQANYICPVSATDSYRLTLRFDSKMDTAQPPTLTLSSDGASSPSVPSPGTWLTTVYENDTYTSPDILLEEGMDGTLTLSVADARDWDGNVMLPAAEIYDCALDATPPPAPSVSVDSESCEGATYTWAAYPTPADLSGFQLYLQAGPAFSEVDGQSFVAFVQPDERQTTVQGLDLETQYHVAIVAIDDLGNFEAEVVSQELFIDEPLPPSVELAVGPGADPNEALLDWSGYAGGALCGFAGFEVYQAPADFVSVAAMTPVLSLGADAREVLIGGLDRGSEQWFAVVGVNASGERNETVEAGLWSDPYAGDIVEDLTIGGGQEREIDIATSMVVDEGATLTIEAGTTLRFAPGTGIEVRDGALVAEGTPFEPVVLTSDADREGLTPERGDWSGVTLGIGSSASSMTHVILRYGQGLLVLGSAPSVAAFTALHNQSGGLRVDAGALTTDQALLRYNEVGAAVEASGLLTLSDSVIKHNDVNASTLGGALNAADNWWGAVDDASVAAGLSGAVSYTPFLLAEPVLTPVIGIAGGLTQVGVRDIEILLPSRNAEEMRLSEDSQFPGVYFEPWTATTTFELSPSGGQKTIFAELRSVTGLNSELLSVTVEYITEGPEIQAFSLQEGQLIQRPIQVTGSATAALGLSGLSFTVDGATLATTGAGALSHYWDIRALSTGTVRVALSAEDSAGNVSAAERNVQVSPTPPPAPVITEPLDGVILASGPLTVRGTAEPGVLVRLRMDGAIVASPVADAAGDFEALALPLLEGASTFVAIAEDSVGSSASSNAVTVVLDTGAPEAVVLQELTPVAGLGIDVHWALPETGEAPTVFDVYRASESFATPAQATRVAQGVTDLTYRDPNPADGSWFYGVVGGDAAGNVAPLSNLLSTSYDASAPVLTVFFDDASPMGPGTHAVELRSTELLIAVPDLTIRTFGSQVPFAVSLVAESDTVYRGTFEIQPGIASGQATLRVSGEDAAGNQVSGAPGADSDVLVLDTRGPSGAITTDPQEPVQCLDPVAVTVTLVLDELPDPAEVPSLSFLAPAGESVGVPLVGSGVNWSGILSLDVSHGAGFGAFSLSAQDSLGNVSTSIHSGGVLEIYNTALPGAPQAPSLLMAMSEPGGGITVTWSVSELAETYALYRSDGECSAVPSLLVEAGVTGLEATDVPPEDGSYCYAVSAARLGSESALSTAMPGLSDGTPPDPPEGVTVELGADGLLVSWSPPSAGEAPVGYEILRDGAVIRQVAGDAFMYNDHPSSGGVLSYEVASRDPIGNTNAAAPVTFDLKVGAVRNVEILVQDDDPPALSWQSTDGSVVGYNVYRGGVKLNGSLLPTAAFVDEWYGGTSRFTYDIRAVNGDGDESPPRTIHVFPLRIEAGVNVDGAGDSRPLANGFFNQADLLVANDDGAYAMSLDEMQIRLTADGQLVHERSRALTESVAPAASYESEWVIPGGSSELDHILRMTAIDRDEVGGTVTYQQDAVFEARRTNDALELSVADVPLAGTVCEVHLCAFNRGYAAMDVVVNRSNGSEPGDVAVTVSNDVGLELGRSEYQGYPAYPLYSGNGVTFIRVEAGEQACVDVDVLVPYALDEGDTIAFGGLVQPIHHDSFGEAVLSEVPLTGSMDSAITHTEYSGTAETDHALYSNDTPVIITGQAIDRDTGLPLPDTALTLGFFTRGFRWSVPITTDASGDYSYTYNPTPGLAGEFVVWAAHPSVVDVIRQAEFVLYRVFVTPMTGSVRASKADSLDFSVKIVNPGDLPLIGMSHSFRAYTIDGEGAEIPEPTVQGTSLIADGFLLGAGVEMTLPLRISADADAPDSVMVEYSFQGVAGAGATFVADVSLEEPVPVLRVSQPSVGYVDASLDRGGLVNVPVTLSNSGLEVLSDAMLTPPQTIDWMFVNRQPNAEGLIELGDIEVGESVTFDVIYAPPDGEEVPLGDHNDLLQVQGSNSPQVLEVGLWALITSELRGQVLFSVTDAYGNAVPEATVRLTNNLIHEQRSAETDLNGELLYEELNPGEWDFQVTAPGHGQSYGVVEVIAEQLVGEAVELSRSVVTVTFTVEPVPFTDRYIITVHQTFETHVPVPVLVVEPASISFHDVEPGFEATTLIKVSNYGLKALDDVHLYIDDSGTARSEPLITYLPRLDAMQSVDIPFKTTYRGPDPGDPPGSFASCVAGYVDPRGTINAMRNMIQGSTSSYFSGAERRAAADLVTALYLYGSFGGVSSIIGTVGGALALCIGEALGAASWGMDADDLWSPFDAPSRPSYGTSRGGDGCFVAGTPVLMADGSQRAIETLGAGDRVLGYDGAPASVRDLHVRRVNHVRELRFAAIDPEQRGDRADMRRVETTDDHLFWLLDEERWAPARALAEGDRVAWLGGAARVTENTRRARQVTVYNPDVEGVESYFANGALVHQGCDMRSRADADARLREFLSRPPGAKSPPGPLAARGSSHEEVQR